MSDKQRCPFQEVCCLPDILTAAGIPVLADYCRENFNSCSYYNRYRRSPRQRVEEQV